MLCSRKVYLRGVRCARFVWEVCFGGLSMRTMLILKAVRFELLVFICWRYCSHLYAFGVVPSFALHFYPNKGIHRPSSNRIKGDKEEGMRAAWETTKKDSVSLKVMVFSKCRHNGMSLYIKGLFI